MGLRLERMCIVLDSDNSEDLSSFYEKLLGWTRHEHKADDEWIAVSSGKEDGTPLLLFQQTEGYQRPVWPNTAGKQQMMMHMDFHVTDLEEGIQHALSCGAALSAVQLEDRWRVMLDPAGHPFCVLPKE